MKTFSLCLDCHASSHEVANVFLKATTLSNCVFTLNNEFTNKRTKFKITTAVQKESAQVRFGATNENMFSDLT